MQREEGGDAEGGGRRSRGTHKKTAKAPREARPVYWKPPADLLQKPPAECGRMSEIENSQSADREHEVSAWVSRGRGTSRAGALGAPVARESGAGTWSRLTRVAGGCKLTCTHARQ